MKHRRKSICSLVLALAIVLGTMPVHARAADTQMQSGDLSVSKPTIAEIQAKYKAVTSAQTRFDEQPSVTAPYATGKLNAEFIESGESYLNYIRYLAGLPAVETTEEKNDSAQHGAVLLAANDELSHQPSQPDDMDDEFYQAGYDATSSSNLSYRWSSSSAEPLDALQSAVSGQMADTSSTSNRSTLGHRRWLINPTLKYTGFGCADSEDGGVYVDIPVFDWSGSTVDYNFVAWPTSGYMPKQEFSTSTPWSITLNPDRYEIPERENLVITVTRQSDGSSDTLNSGTSDSASQTDPYLLVDTQGYGVRNAIIFRPDTSIFGSDLAGEYRVKVTGLEDADGNNVTLEYSVTFFDIETGETIGDLADATIQLSSDGSSWTSSDGAVEYTYDGTAKQPQVRVICNDIRLSEGTDYTLAYADNTNAGTATVTVTGIGSYTGTATRTFIIRKAEQTVTASLSSETILPEETAQITASATAGAISYQSSRPEVATVSASGVVTGVAPGTSTITVTAAGDSNYNSASTELVITVAEVHTHTYGDPAFNWSEDHSDCTATFTCTECGSTQTVDCEVTSATTPATCTESGSTTYTASVSFDGETYTDTESVTIPATGHSWDNGTVTTAATCTEAGVKTYTCTACGETKTESIPATGHSWDNGTVTTPATCTEAGVKTYTCTACGETKTESIPATGHSWDDGTVTTAATCTEAGVKTYTCTACGETKTESIPATGHSWDNGTVTKQPTLTETGIKTYTCTVCHATKTEEIPKLEHKSVSEIFTDVPASAWYVDFVQYVYDNGLMNGTSDTTFEPDSPLSRAMVAQILYAQAGKPDVTGDSPFSDVANSKAWYYDAVVWASQTGVVSGYDDGTFRPMQDVTREQLAVMLYADAGKPAVTGSLDRFADAGRVSHYAKTALVWANQNGIVSGSEQNGKMYLNPRGNATRAEAATMFMRYVELKKK